MKTNPNESAFPEVREEPQFNNHTYGLTKREIFAAMIMANTAEAGNMKMAAFLAVQGADALIVELNKE